MVVKHVLDLATVAVGTKGPAAASDYIEGTTLHLTGHLANHQTRAKIGGYAVNRIAKTSTESMVVTVLAKAIKGSINWHCK